MTEVSEPTSAAVPPRRLRTRTALVCILVAAGLVIAWSEAHALLFPAQRPAPVQAFRSSGGWACPSNFPVPVYAAVFYTVQYPTPPQPSVRPDGCFPNYRSAETAGYRYAPAPAGGFLVDGVYLVAQPNAFVNECRRALSASPPPGRPSIAFPCPRVLPAGRRGIAQTPQVTCYITCSVSMTFPAGPDYPGIGRTRIDGTVGPPYEMSTGELQVFGMANGVGMPVNCPTSWRQLKGPSVSGHSTYWLLSDRLYVVPYGGAALEWTERGGSYGVLMPDNPSNRTIAQIVADHIELVEA